MRFWSKSSAIGDVFCLDLDVERRDFAGDNFLDVVVFAVADRFVCEVGVALFADGLDRVFPFGAPVRNFSRADAGNVSP
jgi:hypothetical protein